MAQMKLTATGFPSGYRTDDVFFRPIHTFASESHRNRITISTTAQPSGADAAKYKLRQPTLSQQINAHLTITG
jgi:hypothetical protein